MAAGAGDDPGQVPDRSFPGRRRNGRGLRGPARRDRQARRDQDDQPGARGDPGGARPLPARGAADVARPPPAHRRRHRHLHARASRPSWSWSTSRARTWRSTCGAVGRCRSTRSSTSRCRPGGGRGGARRGHRPSRPEAAEHLPRADARRHDPSEGARLRDLEGAALAAFTGQDVGRDPGLAELLRAGAGATIRRRSARRAISTRSASSCTSA